MSTAKPRLLLAASDQDDAPLLHIEAVAATAAASRPTGGVLLRQSSPVAAEAARLGLVAAAGGMATTFAVHLPAGFGTGDLAASSTAGMYRAFVHDGRNIAAHADLEAIGGVAAVAGPQVAWAVAANVVGQHFQVEISSKLDALQRGIDALKEVDVHERYSQLAASHLLIQKALARALDGAADVSTTLDLAHQDVLRVLGRQEQWLKKQELVSSSLAAEEHDASDFLEAFPGLSDGSFADGVAITAAAINVHRELLHDEGLIAAGRAEDPYGHYTDLLAKQGQAMTDLEDRLRAVVREIGRLPFAPEQRFFHWVQENPSVAALQGQRAALAIEDGLGNQLVQRLRAPTAMHLTAQPDGNLRMSLPG